MNTARSTILAMALTTALAVVAADVADARVGGGRSIGSRGSSTYTAPPATNTAPKAAPIERSRVRQPAPKVRSQELALNSLALEDGEDC